jgi:hypothetical protein
MGASSLVDRHAIVIRDRIPVLMVVSADEEGGILLVAEVEQPPLDRLLAMVEAQGGLFKPFGLFRYDPLLANAGIRGCPHCGHLWIIKQDGLENPPLRCERCQ